ncbi:hypothetical protein PGT21_029173 [Puccinia graminis f. sp. tritici]|uniref:Uncharacterized protein n=1 Tax=Puccinia graminis f. sp. tritici TaxID=56615 RepID=A0A5B0P1B4_PUCGR|nr:hypothetical protein PGT21_029173 [Puccinia graminis f. sp. tritici]
MTILRPLYLSHKPPVPMAKSMGLAGIEYLGNKRGFNQSALGTLISVKEILMEPSSFTMIGVSTWRLPQSIRQRGRTGQLDQPKQEQPACSIIIPHRSSLVQQEST